MIRLTYKQRVIIPLENTREQRSQSRSHTDTTTSSTHKRKHTTQHPQTPPSLSVGCRGGLVTTTC